MADKQDAVLLIQLAQWGTTLGAQEANRYIFSDDFNPDAAQAHDENVDKLLGWFETIATLTKNGLLDTALVMDWLAVGAVWGRIGPAALRAREKSGLAELYENFEALAAQDKR